MVMYRNWVDVCTGSIKRPPFMCCARCLVRAGQGNVQTSISNIDKSTDASRLTWMPHNQGLQQFVVQLLACTQLADKLFRINLAGNIADTASIDRSAYA